MLGKAVEDFKYVGGEASLLDSKENKWGTVKENAGFLGFGLTYVFHDHNEFLLAKTKKKTFFAAPTFWVEDPEGNNMYKISEHWRKLEYNIKDTSGTVVAQITQEFTGLTSSDYILKVKNINPLIALLIVPTLRRIKHWMPKWYDLGY